MKVFFSRTDALLAAAFCCLWIGASAAQSSHLSELQLGVNYYAEDYPPERVETDARLMQQAGLTVARLIDTNWQRLEPAEGKYDFDWLDRVIETLNRQGIRVILGTSSYVPPAWLIERHPDFYAVTREGKRHRWGGMGFICLNHPVYRGYVEKLVTALGSRYGQHPGVIGWQVDNELGVWGYACYDMDHCVPRWRRYLKEKFGTVEELNGRWLTVSYGHEYSSWDQIPLNWVLGMQAHQAPLELEAQRFFSFNAADFLSFQARLLRRFSSRQFITHNTAPSRRASGFEMARPLDSLGYSNYPRVGTHSSFSLDLMRGFNSGDPFLVLEHRSGYFGPFSLGDATPPPGLVRLWAWQTLAYGANGALFFRWRTSVGGSEQYWQGLLNYDGSPARPYQEVSRMGNEIRKIPLELARSHTVSRVAEIMSYDSLWALHVGEAGFPYFEQLQAFHRAFKRLGQNVDFVHPGADLTSYRIAIAPTLHVLDETTSGVLERFVKGGGVLVLTLRSGFKTPDNLAVQGPPPGLLSALARVSVIDYTVLQESSPRTLFGFPIEEENYRPLSENQIESVFPDWPGVYTARLWADILKAEGAQVLFKYKKDYYAGLPAVTLAEHGKGKVVYVGSLMEPQFYDELALRACQWAQLPTTLIPEGIDLAVREKDGKAFSFLLNFTATPKTVQLPAGGYRDLLDDSLHGGLVEVPALDLKILER